MVHTATFGVRSGCHLTP